MAAPGIERHRDKNGELSRRHGSTLVSTLRKTYGESFAKGFAAHAKLSDTLIMLDDPSLTKLVEDYERKTLQGKLDKHK